MQYNVNHSWGPPYLTWSEASFSNFLKFYLNIPATLLRFSSYYWGSFQLYLGFKILAVTPGRETGYWRFIIGKVLN